MTLIIRGYEREVVSGLLSGGDLLEELVLSSELSHHLEMEKSDLRATVLSKAIRKPQQSLQNMV